jgi:hypothetical protein
VGVLCTIAWFLFTYRGYDRKDDIAGNLACLFALGVAFFPGIGTTFDKAVHFVSATAFFLVLSYFSAFLFTKSVGSPTPEKRVRNRIYISCGVGIFLCLALIGVYYWQLTNTALAPLKPVFWLEALALWAFGISWFVKGETLWKDAASEYPAASHRG